MAAVVTAFVFIAAMAVCAHRRKWPETGPLASMLLGVTGTVAGIKITILTITLPSVQLGALADDKGALILGGIVTFVVSLREAVGHWLKVTGPAL